MSSHEAPDQTRPAVPPRSSQRDSTSQRDSLYRASPQISPIQPAHPVAESSSKAPVAPPVPDKTDARAQPQPAPTPQPTQAQQVQNLFPGVASPETIKTKREELQEGDAHWEWKVFLRALTIVVGLIGIGCAAWITAHFNSLYGSSMLDSNFYFYDGDFLPWTLITFALSVVWSTVCVIAFFARRPNAPVAPGAQVGCDLIIWLGLIVTGAFAIVGTMSVGDWGSDGTLDNYSSYGYYSQASNGTWVWDDSSSSSYYQSYGRSCDSGTSSFSSCAQQDAFVNALWQAKNHRYNIDLTATVCQFIGCLLHFILFVWACVDTHRRNHRGVTKDAEKLAADIVMNMVRNGAIIPAPGQAYFPPMAQQGAPMGASNFGYPNPQYYPAQQSPWQYPGNQGAPIPRAQAPMPQQHQQQQQQQHQQPVVASSSNEKGAGPRYA